MNLQFKCLMALTLFASFFAAGANGSVLKQALEDELERSMKELQLEGVVKPHFIGYTVHTDHQVTASASYGGLKNMNVSRSRRLQIEMRVGTPEFDNTNFISRRIRNRDASMTLPLGDDYDLLRKQIWLATDRAYRRAVEVYAAKEAALQNSQHELTRDFSVEESQVYIDKRRSRDLDVADVRRVTRELAEVGKDLDFIRDRDVVVFANQHLDTYVNSEGSHFTRVDDTAFIRATAWTQSDDGRFVSDYVNIVGRAWKDIADLPVAKREVAAMHDRLKTLSEAEPLDDYYGPVLFQGQAAGELIGQILAPNLVNYRRPVFENDAMAGMFNRATSVSSLAERLGTRVLPRSWHVYDDPTQETYQGARLVGHYPIDSDGLKTHRVNLVEKGVLKTLLTDRNPTEKVQRSTASNATGSNPSVSNLFIEADDGLTDFELNRMLIDLVQETEVEFGVRIDRAANPFAQASGIPSPYLGSRFGEVLPAQRAYKVYPNGDEELVRHVVVFVDLDSALKNLPGYSASVSVHNSTYMFQGGDVSLFSSDAPVFVSIATPNILVEDAMISYPRGVVRSLPIVPHPFAE